MRSKRKIEEPLRKNQRRRRRKNSRFNIVITRGTELGTWRRVKINVNEETSRVSLHIEIRSREELRV